MIRCSVILRSFYAQGRFCVLLLTASLSYGIHLGVCINTEHAPWIPNSLQEHLKHCATVEVPEAPASDLSDLDILERAAVALEAGDHAQALITVSHSVDVWVLIIV